MVDKIRNLTNDDLNYIKDNLIQYITIPAETKLYRTSPNICLYQKNIDKQKQECKNTGRHGVYFSTYLFQALAMALEYNKDLQLGEFITTVDIPAIIGKYSYRFIHPTRHFQWNIEKNVMILRPGEPHTRTANEELTHFNHEIYPIVNFTSDDGKHIEYNMNEFDEKLKPSDGEIFITDEHELKNIRLLKTYFVNVSKLKRIVEENIDDLSPYSFNMYKEALSKIRCNTYYNITRKYRKYRPKYKKIKKTNRKLYK